MEKIFQKTVAILGSFGLAAVLLILLLVLTLFGTLEQEHKTIYDVHKEYFSSLYVVHYWDGQYPIPWPGAMLLLPLLFMNLIVGGLMRMRKGTSTLGVFIIHLGIVVLLVGSWFEHRLKTEGMLTLQEGESGNTYINRDVWELAITEKKRAGGPSRTFVIPPEAFHHTRKGGTARFSHPDLPFETILHGFARNSEVRRATADDPAGRVVEGWVLEPKAPVSAKEKSAKKKMNRAGVYLNVRELESGATHDAIVAAGTPYRLGFKDAAYAFGVRPRSWELPFAMRLDEFVHELHPGTGMARRYSSYVTQITEGEERKHHITMNEPLRYDQYTLYQTGWDQDRSRKIYYSSFSVVRNPSDKVPLISCIIIGIGLLIHFGRKLYLHLKAQSRRQANERSAA